MQGVVRNLLRAKTSVQAQKENWELLLSEAFGVALDESNTISLEKCRTIASNIAMRLQSDEITRRIEQEVAPVADNDQKSKLLMDIVVDMNIEVLSNFGLEGEDGYCLYQASTMQYATDPQIQQAMAPAMMHVQLKACAAKLLI